MLRTTCFLMMAVALFTAAPICWAEQPNNTDSESRNGERPQRPRRPDSENTQRRPGDRPPGQFRGGPAPDEMVKRMMEEFDEDGDKKLDSTELKKMFTTMRERRGAGMQRPSAGNRRPGSGENNTPGGESPRRPPSKE
ncbi:MAG: EF-hand domain-containing protein [Pirellulales bacterium]